MQRVYKNLCPATISASIVAANMWKNSLKTVESDNNKILYEILFDFFYSETVQTIRLNSVRYCYHEYLLLLRYAEQSQSIDIACSLYKVSTFR